MSAEHIANHAHLKDLQQKSIQNNDALLQSIKETTSSHHRPSALDPRDGSTIQQLLSNKQHQTKQNLIKKSIEMMPSKPQHTAAIDAQLAKEVDQFFNQKPPSSHDNVSLSSQSPSHATNDDVISRHQGSSYAAANAAKKNKKDPEKTSSSPWFTDPKESDEPAPTSTTKSTSSANQLTSKRMSESAKLTHGDLKEFAMSMSKHALSQHPNTKRTIEKKRQQLLQRGISTTELTILTTKVGHLIRQHVTYDLKQQLINYHMAKGFSHQEQIERSLQFNQSSSRLNEWHQNGRLPGDTAHIMDRLKHQAKQDLSHFLFHESVNQFTKHSLGQLSLQEFTDELVKLQKAAQSAGVELSEKELTAKICNAIDHLGLGEFSSPNQHHQDTPQKNPITPILSQEEQLDDKLRYLYMMKALHPNLRNKIDIHFKMKKCKNGMIKLGIYTDEKDDQLKKQGDFLAAKQLMNELRFIFREEASLLELNGPEYGVLQKKKTFFLSQLKKTGHPPSENELHQMKESTHREMYGLIKEEIMQLEERIDHRTHVSVTRQLKHLKGIVSRIAEHVVINDHPIVLNQLTTPARYSTINEGV
ncbi:MAG: hypothetical protein ACO3K7_00595 [Candidatus Marinamargulisbacteria bacterium]